MKTILLILLLTAICRITAYGQTGADGPVRDPSISDDGRFVAFSTRSTNLIIGSEDNQENVGFFDREKRKIYNVQSFRGATYWGGALFPQISNDGNWVTFQSSNSFIPDSVSSDIYVSAVRSRTVGLAPSSGFARISKNAAGDPGNAVSNYPTISSDGRYVAYMSRATNLTADVVTGTYEHIYRHDRDFDEDGEFDESEPGATQTILISKSGTAVGNAQSRWPTISADGQTVLFITDATNLPNDDFYFGRVWKNGVVSPTQADRRGLSPSGAQTLSRSRVYPAGDTSTFGDYYRYEVWRTRTIGFPDFGGGNIANFNASLILSSTDHDTAANTTGERQVYLFDRTNQTTTLISTGPNGPGNGDSGQRNDNDAYLDLSQDGRFVAYVTQADNLGFTDTNGTVDVMIVDRVEGIRDRIEADTTPPSWPAPNLSVSDVTHDTAKLTWNAATDLGGISGYLLDLGENPVSSRSVRGPGTMKELTGLKPGTAYTATITANDPSDNKTEGASVSFTTLADPAPSDRFEITGYTFGSTLTFTFRSKPGETYTIERSASGGDWQMVETNIGSQGSYTTAITPTPAELGNASFFRVRRE